MHTATNATIASWSADYRLTQRPSPLPTETRIFLLRRYLVEMAEFSWTSGYQEKARELAELEAK